MVGFVDVGGLGLTAGPMVPPVAVSLDCHPATDYHVQDAAAVAFLEYPRVCLEQLLFAGTCQHSQLINRHVLEEGDLF